MDFYYKVVKTPTTAHSTCSIFALDSPGPQPRVHFGCEREHLYNLDFGSLKTTSGYVVGMRSESQHQLVLDKKYKGHNADEYPIRGPETTGTPNIRLSNGLEYNEGNTSPVKEEESAYKSPSPPPTPYPAFRALEPELFPPIKGSSCGGYEVYKKSLPFRQLGWSSQGEIISREISLPTRRVQFSSFPSPMVPPARELPPHRRAVREPLLPMLVYHDNGEEEIVSRYNYLPFGRQARDPTPNALEDLVAEARANGFTTEPESHQHISSRDWYDCAAGSPECEQLPSARKKAREDLFAALSRRLESRPPPQYIVMPDPPFPWMRR
ncbi:TPA_exp: Uncharacterized protein A8136_4319 [Trichophyton benhamiae CBS 112371]|uniref:Uncharacterized protein n=1 Tax=Arthroderma benhamiae (strain ATCC MYA-4681 / CBS 112371) TaxID=663331 RepID=D4AMT1_ARTBC|nr:uncharacterized protein ARB_05534 [Trichophyton benhamiae CBS 112371]EFE35492.1 hypothetical protein ARB_05534 [Trichophyton benhamiae CBS 112371]DAA78343.1 TPA_exp: Uncharacterized protein A8136_4319 [Trichophyton benhamiae CBS 112371]